MILEFVFQIIGVSEHSGLEDETLKHSLQVSGTQILKPSATEAVELSQKIKALRG